MVNNRVFAVYLFECKKITFETTLLVAEVTIYFIISTSILI